MHLTFLDDFQNGFNFTTRNAFPSLFMLFKKKFSSNPTNCQWPLWKVHLCQVETSCFFFELNLRQNSCAGSITLRRTSALTWQSSNPCFTWKKHSWHNKKQFPYFRPTRSNDIVLSFGNDKRKWLVGTPSNHKHTSPAAIFSNVKHSNTIRDFFFCVVSVRTILKSLNGLHSFRPMGRLTALPSEKFRVLDCPPSCFLFPSKMTRICFDMICLDSARNMLETLRFAWHWSIVFYLDQHCAHRV